MSFEPDAQPQQAQARPQPPEPAAPLTRVPWGAVALFVAVAYGLAWLVMLPLLRLDPETAADMPMATQLLLSQLPAVMMFTPAIAMLVVVFFAKTPRRARARFLGLWPLRPAKRVVWLMVIGYFGPLVLVALALGIALLFGWLTPDFAEFSGYAELLVAAGAPAELARTAAITQLVVIPFAGVLNIFVAFGEEVGWRGWLLPALRPLGTWRALLVSGVIWGLWHTPVTLLGHNFQLYDWRGVAVMTVGATLLGTLFGWLRLRSGSVWPAVLAHAAFNAAAGVYLVVSMAGAPLELWLVNPLGVSGWIAAAIIIVVLAAAGQFGKQPGLAPPRR